MIEILKTIIEDNSNIQFAYLFGSYAKDEATEQSDIDIAVYLLDTALERRLDFIYTLQKVLKKSIDLVVLNNLKNIYLLESILKDGILLKDASGRPIFEVDSNLAILDFKAFKRYIDAS